MKKMYFAISSVLIAVAALVTVNITGTSSLAATGARDCNNNSIIYCGSLNQSELLTNYDKNATGDLPAIFGHYGIARSDLAGTTSEVKMGRAFRDGRVEVDGKVVATNAYSLGRNNVGNNRPVSINGKTYYERASADVFRSDIDAFVLMRNGQFYRAVLTSCSNPLVATAKPQPTYSCDALKATKVSRTEYNFTTNASAANGATITGYVYDFGDGKSTTSTNANVSHTYEKAGRYTVKVSVKVQVNGETKTVTGAHCETVVVVEEKPPTPIFDCNALSAQVISLKDRSYEYTLTYTAENGATLESVDYNFGDEKTTTVNGSADQTVEHTYASAGSYKTVATLHFNVKENGETTTKDIKCEVAISTSPEMCPLNPSLPKNDERCQPCEVPGKEDLPKDSPKCKTPVTPQELPKTGIGELLSGGLGIGSLTAASYYWQGSRRSLTDKLRNR